MRTIVLLITLVLTQLAWSQTYSFSAKMVYSGFSTSPYHPERYVIYFNPGDYKVWALEHIDERESSNGILIIDQIRQKQLLLDPRERTAVQFPMTPVNATFWNIDLDSVGMERILQYNAIVYKGQKQTKQYVYTIAIQSPRVDSLFGTMNALGIDFIKYPQGFDRAILKYIVLSSQQDTLSMFTIKQLKIDSGRKFNLKNYKLRSNPR